MNSAERLCRAVKNILPIVEPIDAVEFRLEKQLKKAIREFERDQKYNQKRKEQ